MQIILLSGGSGKRLWPLSNSTRSKQFLQLLQDPDGKKESMVQRVVRQIGESALDAEVIIATSAAQRDFIETQLGSKVEVVTEPERRETFPAIALSASYLAWEKGCSRDEVVVVMPCDTFTEARYFETIGTMASLVERRLADLVLMGVTATHASADFGYVMPGAPQADGAYSMVEHFVEKPTERRAHELIAQGAYWNGGVFAFRLGYMLDMTERYVQASSYGELRSRYDVLPKISFDYEVAEKAASMAVVPFCGKWKDLGDWNALVHELPAHAMGNVVLGGDVMGTTVINELSLPVVCDGVDNVVVAAGHDGILVCSRKSSEYIKQYVDPMHMRPMFEERRWGTYRVLDDARYADGSHSLTKSITLHPGKYISYQIHHHRTEVWTFVEGEGIFVLDGEPRRVKAGDTVIIPVEHYHSIKALTELTFIEVQMGNPLIEEDIERFDWDWENITLE
jgi:mannose-1-phosphate guanylyltransferase